MGNILGYNMKDWKEEKARILALSVEERRKLYTCGDKYVPLSEISTWSEQVKSKENDVKSNENEEKSDESEVNSDNKEGKSDKEDVKSEDKKLNKSADNVTEDDVKSEEKENPDATACDPKPETESKSLDLDPDWIKELKNVLAEDVAENKLDFKIDLSTKVSVFVGDITKLEIDGIVNAANSSLLGGGGVDGAIHRAAGKLLYLENKTHNGCSEGEAKSSGGYYLPAKFVISTVGPQGEYPEVLSNCYSNCLTLLSNNSLRSIAFPCISTGVYGYPNTAACSVALRTVRRWLEEEKNHEKIDRIVFCLFMQKDQDIYSKMLPLVFPTGPQPAKL